MSSSRSNDRRKAPIALIAALAMLVVVAAGSLHATVHGAGDEHGVPSRACSVCVAAKLLPARLSPPPVVEISLATSALVVPPPTALVAAAEREDAAARAPPVAG
jgi:hypothetical protein